MMVSFASPGCEAAIGWWLSEGGASVASCYSVPPTGSSVLASSCGKLKTVNEIPFYFYPTVVKNPLFFMW